MHEDAAISLIEETFDKPYDRKRFREFANNFVSGYDPRHKAGIVPDSFKGHIKGIYRLGKIVDTDRHEIDIVEVKLKRTDSVHRARTMQRNFVARYLRRRDKDAALVAFIAPDEDSWRFSLVTQEIQLMEDLAGRVKVKIIPTPAKRLSFRLGGGERTHTAKRQLLPILKDNAKPTLDIIRGAFSVETVSREFFEKYRELFYRTVEALEVFLGEDEGVATHFSDRGIEASDFAKRLLGQIVFLYFLQKKGWLGVARDSGWGEGDRDFMRALFERATENNVNFFDGFLEHLFYDALAVDNSPEDHFHDRFGCRLPFLNGGLFEPFNDYQWRKTTILIDNALFSNANTTPEGDVGDGILDIFDRYNFTVAEDEPLEKEVAVDPEMLGKVFENLLEVKDRKQSGTYYTPREIVHYMCQESLIAYLSRRVPTVPTDDIETLIRYGDLFLETDAEVQNRRAGKKGAKSSTGKTSDKTSSKTYGEYLLPDTVREASAELDEALATVRVCDPAIGSGAFLVGMMTEIVRARTVLRQHLGHEQPPYQLKFRTIHDSLYGVDIDPGAIEIAKLRLWLSLVVDEEAYDHVQPLPNLDYRIMQGNSLLETYEDIRLFDDSILRTEIDTQNQESLKERLKVRQGELTAELTALANQPLDARHQAQRKEIEGEARKINKALKKLESARTDGLPPMDLLDSLNVAVRREKELRVLHEAYFSETDRRRKMDLRTNIEDVEWRLIEESLKEQGKADRLEDVARYRRTKTRPFFLWKLHFSEVFHPVADGGGEEPLPGGFDIVIANPPYVRADKDEEHAAMRTLIKNSGQFETLKGKWDLYVAFIEIGYQLLASNGQMCMIISDAICFAVYADAIKNYLLKKSSIEQLDFLGKIEVFDASVHNIILRISHDYDPKNIPDRLLHIGQFGEAKKLLSDHQENLTPRILFIPDDNLVISPASETVCLKDICYVSVGMVVNSHETKSPEKFKLEDVVSEAPTKNNTRPFVEGKDVSKWLTPKPNWLEWGTERAPHYFRRKTFSELQEAKGKILAQRSPGPDPICCIDKIGIHYSESSVGMVPWNQLHGIRNRSIKKVARYCDEKGGRIDLPERENLEAESNNYDILYLLGILSSGAATWFLKQDRRSNIHVYPDDWKNLPVPIISRTEQSPLIELVNKILELKKENADAHVFDLEAKIDRLVYELYGLTDDEIALIETSLPGGKAGAESP